MDIHDPTFDAAQDILHDTGHEDMFPAGLDQHSPTDTSAGSVAGPVGGGLDDHPGGSGDAAATRAGGPMVSVTINGEPIEAHATIDSNGDGTKDTAIVDLDDGYKAAVTDLTGDGQADRAQLMDASGHVVDNQHIDPSGAWVDDGNAAGGAASAGSAPAPTGHTDPAPEAAPAPSTGGPADSTLTIEYGGHEYAAEATIDTNGDGRPDSGVLTDPRTGAYYVATDFDGDGRADHLTVYDAQGHEVAAGGLTSDGSVVPDGGSATRGATYAVDPATGEWTSY